MTIINRTRYDRGELVRPSAVAAKRAYHQGGQDDFIGPPRLTKDAGYMHVQRFRRTGPTLNMARQNLARTMENFSRAMSRVIGYRLVDVHEDIQFTSRGYAIDVHVVYVVEEKTESRFQRFLWDATGPSRATASGRR